MTKQTRIAVKATRPGYWHDDEKPHKNTGDVFYMDFPDGVTKDTPLPSWVEPVGELPDAEPEAPTKPDDEAIKKVLDELDPSNADNWTSKGQAKMEVVEKALGVAENVITREDVERASPGFNQKSAAEAKAAAT